MNFSDVNMRVLGVMGILKLPYSFTNEVCTEATTEDGENCNSEVGMLQGTAYTHVKEFPVRRIYPQVSSDYIRTPFIGVSLESFRFLFGELC